MHIGLIGLGRMGANMRERLRQHDIEVTGYDRNPELTDVASLADLVAALPSGRRVVWVMVPAGEITRSVVSELASLLTKGDIVIEGGNSHFEEDKRHATELKKIGIGYVDCGVSGGVWGLENGYGLMVGGEPEVVEHLMPVFDALRPEGPRAEGFVHAGPSAPVTTRRWCTTASSTDSCRPTPRATSCSRRRTSSPTYPAS